MADYDTLMSRIVSFFMVIVAKKVSHSETSLISLPPS